MIYLNIIGDPSKAASLLKTNRPLHIGMKIQVEEAVAKSLNAEAPEIFQLDKGFTPKSNKLLKRTIKTKTK
jgi:hypothetical protein